MIVKEFTELGDTIGAVNPRLRHVSRIRNIHSSLTIENDTLSLEQVTDVVDGKSVLELLRKDSDMSIETMFEALGTTNRAVKRNLRSLRNKGLISREGSKGTGIWIVHGSNRFPYLRHWISSTHALLRARRDLRQVGIHQQEAGDDRHTSGFLQDR